MKTTHIKKTNYTDPSKISDTLFSQLDLSLYIYNHEQEEYEYMSHSIFDMTGYTFDELKEIGFSKIIKNIDTSNTNNQRSAKIAGDYYATYLIEAKDKKIKLIEDISFHEIDNEGNIIKSRGVLREITPLVKSFAELEYQNENLNKILDAVDLAIIIFGPDGELINLNKIGLSIFGLIAEDLKNENWQGLIPNSYFELLKKLRDENTNKKEKSKYELELELESRTGNEILLSWKFVDLYDDKGNVIFGVGIGRDITSIKKENKINEIINKILHNSNVSENLDEFFDFMREAIKELMPVNNFYISLYDEEKDLLYFPYFKDEEDDEALPKKFRNGLTEFVIKTGKAQLINEKRDKELVEQHKVDLVGSPTKVWLGIPLIIGENTIGALVVQDYHDESTYDIKEKEILELIGYSISRTIERKRVESERKKLVIDLEKINKSKDQLFSLISHDLRSPFNSLLGFSEILSTEYETLTDEEAKEYINAIYESSKNLYSMTTNLLEYSRFQVGRFLFDPDVLNLENIVDHNLSLLKGNFVKKDIEVSVNIDSNYFIYADEDMINSVIQNLLSNAVKFTFRGGKISINASKEIVEEKEMISIVLTDNGIGMKKQDIDKIFSSDVFSCPGTEKEFGTGLGLQLVIQFIHKNNGTIDITSKINKGTTFTIKLPTSK